MLINKELLDNLTSLAKSSPRLRMHFDLRDSIEDESQRILNAIEPGTIIPIHRHIMTSEDVIVLRGRAEEVYYDANGNETNRIVFAPNSDSVAIHVPKGQYHTCRSLESGTVILEFKNTRYDPEKTEDYLQNK